MMMCCKCKKRPAVVFMSGMNGNQPEQRVPARFPQEPLRDKIGTDHRKPYHGDSSERQLN